MSELRLPDDQLARLAVLISAEPILTDDQLVRLADLIADRLCGVPSASDALVDAAELGRQLGLSRATIYARKAELGAVRVGNGSRARLRFDVERATEALRAAPTLPPQQPPRPRKRRAAKRGHVFQSRPRVKS
jgi:hypothetical protein